MTANCSRLRSFSMLALACSIVSEARPPWASEVTTQDRLDGPDDPEPGSCGASDVEIPAAEGTTGSPTLPPATMMSMRPGGAARWAPASVAPAALLQAKPPTFENAVSPAKPCFWGPIERPSRSIASWGFAILSATPAACGVAGESPVLTWVLTSESPVLFSGPKRHVMSSFPPPPSFAAAAADADAAATLPEAISSGEPPAVPPVASPEGPAVPEVAGDLLLRSSPVGRFPDLPAMISGVASGRAACGTPGRGPVRTSGTGGREPPAPGCLTAAPV